MKIYRKLQTECNLKERENIANFLALYSKKGFLENKEYKSHLSNESLSKLRELTNYGFCLPNQGLKSLLSDKTNLIVNYFKNEYGYNAHVPIYAKNKVKFSKDGTNTENGYISFDTKTVLKCPLMKEILLEISKNKEISAYLNCKPKLYSCNTFWTFPKETKLLTHSWHRDLDDFKFLSVFIYWTETNKENGFIKFIKGSHTHLDHLNILEKNKKLWFTKSFDKFYSSFPSKELRDKFYRLNKEVPNGYGFNNLYEKIFSKEIVKLYGSPGTYIICDTFGLHSGSVVKEPRLVTWFRFGLYENLACFYDKNRIPKKDMNILESYNSEIKDIDFSLLYP